VHHASLLYQFLRDQHFSCSARLSEPLPNDVKRAHKTVGKYMRTCFIEILDSGHTKHHAERAVEELSPMAIAVPPGVYTLSLLILLVFLGVTQRVLARMRLSNAQALVILGAFVAGSFLPAISLGRILSVDVGGAIVPAGVAIYLVATADTSRERIRGTLAALITGAVLVMMHRFLPAEPGLRQSLPVDIDPVWAPGLVAAAVGYLSGRSRRSAFIAGISGVIIADIASGVQNALAGRQGSQVVIGGAGVLDTVVIAAVVAVALCEVFGETLEFLRSRRARTSRPASGRNLLGAGITAFSVAVALLAANTISQFPSTEPMRNRVHSIYDRAGNPITMVGWQVFRGDEYLAEDYTLYRVFSVRGQTAWAVSRGKIDPSLEVHEFMVQEMQLPKIPPVLVRAPGPVAIYHSHNDESYVPTQGTYSIDDGPGGIHAVGDEFAAQLRSLGFTVHKSDALHHPHDRGAYIRSRRTALELLRQRPAAMFDVHRDATPWHVYAGEVGGVPISRIRLVVGRQNPHYAANRAFALSLTDIGNTLHPGLMLGIYFGRGSYNQDLSPFAVLIEAGAHTNTQQSAMRGISLFADAVAAYFGLK